MNYTSIAWCTTVWEFVQQNMFKYNGFPFKLTKWQRNNSWNLKDERSLIESMVGGICLHKIILGNITDISDEDNCYWIIDGGHRYRTIQAFCNNEFYIKYYVGTSDEVHLYYNKSDDLQENERSLQQYPNLLMKFNTGKLNFDIYENITENQAIKLFLRINNSGPLTVAEWINASIHPAIVYFRTHYKNENSEFRTHLEIYCPKKDRDNHEYLNQLIPFLYAYHKFNNIKNDRPITDDMVEQLFAYGEPIKTRNNKMFEKLEKFINEINDDIDIFTPEYLNNFVISLGETKEHLQTIFQKLKKKIRLGDTLTGYVMYLMGKFDNDEFAVRDNYVVFLDGEHGYKLAENKEKCTRKSNETIIKNDKLHNDWTVAKTALDNIDCKFISYSKTFESNPRSQEHCIVRYNLIVGGL